MNNNKLYIIATPIGNLGDISLRAIDILKEVDLVISEDTRVSSKLFSHYNIKTPLMSYHQHSDEKKVKYILAMLAEGKNIALVTDAGTPGISDPGNKLVSALLSSAYCYSEQSACHSNTQPCHPECNEGSLVRSDDNIKGSFTPLRSVQDDKIIIKMAKESKAKDNGTEIIPIPGACAAITALSISGFATDKFIFMGFPPHKNKRQKFFREVADAKYTVVFYESCHRIIKCLTDLEKTLSSDQQIMIGRELTKKFEQTYRGTIKKIKEMNIKEKGEFVVVISKLYERKILHNNINSIR